MNSNIQALIGNPYVFYPFLIWSIVWKGLALWRAARLKQVWWYVALLVINTVGIFEIIYLLATGKKEQRT